MPRSMPTRRLSFISSPVVVSVPPARPQERRTIRPRSQGRHAPTAAPTHVLQPAPDLDGPSHFPHPGHPWPAGCGNQIERGQTPPGPPPEPISTPPPGPAGMTMQPWDPSPVVDPRCRCPLHELRRRAATSGRTGGRLRYEGPPPAAVFGYWGGSAEAIIEPWIVCRSSALPAQGSPRSATPSPNRLDVPYIELDGIFHQPNWTRCPHPSSSAG